MTEKSTEAYRQQLKAAAMQLIRQAYEIAARMQDVDVRHLNAGRPPEFRYRNRGDLVREFTERANGMVQFAADLGLITVEEAMLIARESGSGLAKP